jgi:serine protease AprX
MRNVSVHLLTIIVCFSGFCRNNNTWASPIRPELELKLKQAGPETEISVIVSLHEKVDLSFFKGHEHRKFHPNLIRALNGTSNRTQKRLKAFLKREGVGKIKSLWLINSLAVTAKTDIVRMLATFPEVADIRSDRTISLPETQYETTGEAEWNMERINAPALWSLGITGKGITVANMDSGVDVSHNDLNSGWRGGDNSWYDLYGEHGTPYDDHGHGTQTMGILVGGDATGSAIGVAPDANWIAVKIFNDAGDANFSDIHLGFQWLLDPDGDPNTNDAPQVVNNSWGLIDNVNECVLEFYDDIEILKTAGIAIVFAAGNEGPQDYTSISPANYNNSFAVGSIDSSNNIAYGSSRGPSPCHIGIFPNVVSPGVNIKTSDSTFGGILPNNFDIVTGTSFAAPHVSGAMALLIEAFPTVTPEEIEDALALSAEDLGPAGADYYYGHGLINLMAAYELLESSFCSGDFNHDESVDLLDLGVLTVEWLRTNCTNCWSDLNGDQKIDFYDFSRFAGHYEQLDCP